MLRCRMEKSLGYFLGLLEGCSLSSLASLKSNKKKSDLTVYNAQIIYWMFLYQKHTGALQASGTFSYVCSLVDVKSRKLKELEE